MRTASPSLRSSPRQAVVRASFRLAPWLATRPCDLPADKTLDASYRRLPPNRTACTRTSCVPGPLSRLSPRGHPTESWAPCGIAGGRGDSRLPRPLRWIAPDTIQLRFVSRAGLASLSVTFRRSVWAASVGVVFPRCLEFFDRASDTPVASSSSAEYGVGFPTLRLSALAPSLAPS
jgi:hypothetical protein